MFQEKQTFWDHRRRKASQGSSDEVRDHLIKKETVPITWLLIIFWLGTTT
jgi:hypothetical protein